MLSQGSGRTGVISVDDVVRFLRGTRPNTLDGKLSANPAAQTWLQDGLNLLSSLTCGDGC
jgi:hypothetical protein